MSEDLMQAVHEAVIEHGYKDLSISKIGEKYSKGKSNIYHHYDGKEDLMLAFLDHLKDCLDQEMCMEDGSAEEELDKVLDRMLGLENEEAWEFRKAMLEMKSEAPINQKFANKITQIDNEMQGIIEEKLSSMGVEQAAKKSDLMLSVIEGVVDRKLTMQEKEGLLQQKEYIKKIIDFEL